MTMPYRPADLEPEVWRRRQCTSDACKQGRKPCPTPTACVVEEPGDSKPHPQLRAWFWRLYLACVLVAVAYGVSLL